VLGNCTALFGGGILSIESESLERIKIAWGIHTI